MIKLEKLKETIADLFSRKKSAKSLEMWDKLADSHDDVSEFNASLDLDAQYALSLDPKDRDKYLFDLMRRRQEAHENDL